MSILKSALSKIKFCDHIRGCIHSHIPDQTHRFPALKSITLVSPSFLEEVVNHSLSKLQASPRRNSVTFSDGTISMSGIWEEIALIVI